MDLDSKAPYKTHKNPHKTCVHIILQVVILQKLIKKTIEYIVYVYCSRN